MFLTRFAEPLTMATKYSVLFFPGKNKPLKQYTSYFPRLQLCLPPLEPTPAVLLCHSKGLTDAILYLNERKEQRPIVAMDPSDNITRELLATQPNVWVFRQSAFINSDSFTLFENVNWYTEKTHYPYMHARLRDVIEDMVLSLSVLGVVSVGAKTRQSWLVDLRIDQHEKQSHHNQRHQDDTAKKVMGLDGGQESL